MTTSEIKPYQELGGSDRAFDWYMLPFDKGGTCTGPRTRQRILEEVGGGGITDVFLFSHGWNNDWNVATGRYRDFINGYLSMRRDREVTNGRSIRPLLVGVFWPSTALVFGDERGLDVAGGLPSERAVSMGERECEIEAVAAELTPDTLPRFYELVDRPELTRQAALDLMSILDPVLARSAEDDPPDDVGSPDATIDLWAAFSAVNDQDEGSADPEVIAEELADFGRVRTDDELAGASLLGKLDPRKILRLVTMRTMKDRAGTVGAKGVGPVLVDLLAAGQDDETRVHLIGHSYGAKVCLSAVCYPEALPRQVTSMLLLQPAVNHRCFADDKLGRGGYWQAPDRVNLPILTTYSARDKALRRLFHYAARRSADVDELRIAAGKPDRFSALGGYGPYGLEGAAHVDVRLPGEEEDRYDLGPDAPAVYGVHATRTISGHGQISNLSTWWALDNLVTADPREAV